MVFLHGKNVVCLGAKLKNKEVKVCEILVMLPFVIFVTSHIYSFPEILEPDESFLKLCLSNDNSQTGLLNSYCQEFGTKCIKHGNNDPDVAPISWQRHFFYKQKCFLDYQCGKQMCFCQKRGGKIWCIRCINVGLCVTEETGFTTVYKVYKYCHHCPEEGLNQAVSPTLMHSKFCESSVSRPTAGRLSNSQNNNYT